MNPDVSIVMPTFKQGKYIEAALKSIVQQDFENWELIVVIDGEDPETEDILKFWTKKDYRIEYFKKPNGGTGSALNRGFLETKGRYETWFASDNIMYPNCLRVLVSELNNNLDIDYVYSNIHIGEMDGTGLKENKRLVLNEILGDLNWEFKKTLKGYYFGICWLWRRDLRLYCGPFQLEPSEDYDMILRMQEAGIKLKYISEILGWYRRHKENITNKLVTTAPDPHYYSRFVADKARKRHPKLYE